MVGDLHKELLQMLLKLSDQVKCHSMVGYKLSFEEDRFGELPRRCNVDDQQHPSLLLVTHVGEGTY